MSLKITVLGCGNSSGTPSVGNYWGMCDPSEPKNRRNRACLAVQSDDATVIIDTGADFRHQMNAFDISALDGVFYTHHHSDHCHGIDDLRSMFFRNERKSIPCFGHKESLEEILLKFHYLFKGGNNERYYPPMLDAHVFDAAQYGRVQNFKDIEFIPYEMDHGSCMSVGYRFGSLAYSVDMKTLDQKALDVIKGSDIWVVDGAGYHADDNAVHANLKALYEYNDYIGAKSVYVTCLSSAMDYKTLCDELPVGFYPAYDGLAFEL
ncbi:MAG: MBL fold metallo-hydrolase [Alphaproteobacteria bacterium]